MSSTLLDKVSTLKQPRTKICPSQLEVDELITEAEQPPVVVDGDRLEVDSSRLECGRVYSFDYLDSEMVLWKSEDGSVDIYQIVEE